MSQETFNRVEKKYLLNTYQYDKLMIYLKDKIEPNKFFYSKICNVYFDTDNYDLIRKSIEKPKYKEKVRARSYGVPDLNDYVFFEIKKKCQGVVGKRRIEIKLSDLYNYINFGFISKSANPQILKEISYCFNRYNLKPKMYIAYDRYSYYGRDNKNFRITFDTRIRSRNYDLNLDRGDYGEMLLNDGEYLMEVKTLGGVPIWFSHLLSELKIYSRSFSKYGNAYKRDLMRSINKERVMINV